MPDSSADRDPLDRLAEEFVARLRAGERPPISEYAARLPDRADEVRDLFPALVEMEYLKPVSADRTGAFVPEADPHHPARVGEFRILRQVGHGGMGVVYEALQESLGRHVALKLLPPEAVADPKRLERFRREAKAAARLHHTNIVPVFGTGEADGRHYYAMQFIAGHPLDAVIDEVRRLKEKSAEAGPVRAVTEVAAALVTNTFAPLSPSPLEGEGLGERGGASTPGAASPLTPNPSPSRGEGRSLSSPSLSDGGAGYFGTVARLGAQAADALAYAHAQGVLHRDIKPANLLLDLQGTVWVTDFGLAKSADADDLTHAGDIVGTLRYMAPERFDGGGDARSDVYALGLTLYELLTLRPAFVADSRAKLVELVTAASPPSPRSVNPAIPRDLETVVLKAIARDPAMRYQSAGELADDLRRFTEDRPIRARRASSAEQAFRWCRRNKAVASLIAAVILVSVTGAVVASVIARQQKRTATDLENALSKQRATAFELEVAAHFSEVRRKELVRQGDFTGRLLYASYIVEAQLALNDGRVGRVVELLRETTPKPDEPDLRNWEWHYLSRQLQPDRTVSLLGGDAPNDGWLLTEMTFSDDGARVALRRETAEGLHFEVRETFTGKMVRRIPEAGVLPDTKEVVKRARAELSSVVSLPTPLLRFSSDGGHALVYWRANRNTDVGAFRFDARSRFWNLGTGESTSPPAGLAGADVPSRFVVGPGAAWVAWIEYPRDRTNQPTYYRDSPETGPVTVTAYRWDRAADRVTPSDPFPIGKDSGVPTLSPDGRTVYWAAQVRPVWSTMGPIPKGAKGGMPREDDPRFSGPLTSWDPWFECWDVATATPRPRFEARRLPSVRGDGTNYAGSGGSLYTLSPGGAMMAYRTMTSVLVYRVSDGELHATFPLTGRLRGVASVGSVNTGEFRLLVSDDGESVFLRLPSAIHVLTRRQPDGEPRRILFPEEARSVGYLAVRPDGAEVAAITGPTKTVRVWATDPTPTAQNRTGPLTPGEDGTRRFATDDGRVVVEWSGAAEEGPFPKAGPPRPTVAYLAPIVVKDAAGKELGRITEPARFSRLQASSWDDGKRLLLTFSTTAKTDPKKAKISTGWWLYDLSSGVRLLAEGAGRVTRPPDSRFLVEEVMPVREPSPEVGGVLTSHHVTLYDATTGRMHRKIELPNRTVRFAGFDPMGRTFLVESAGLETAVAPPPRAIHSAAELAVAGGAIVGRPVRRSFGNSWTATEALAVHLYDAATGARIRSWAVGTGGVRLLSAARFSPDGTRVALRYSARNRLEAGTAPSARDEERLWVARADAAGAEHDVLLASVVPGPVGAASRNAATPIVWCPDGRHVAVPVMSAVHVWDLTTGERKHRLGGGDGEDQHWGEAAYNADGTRLFTRVTSAGPSRIATPRPVHVWDTTTGRELLVLPVPESRGEVRLLRGLSFDAHKVFLSGGRAGAGTVFDGTPVKP